MIWGFYRQKTVLYLIGGVDVARRILHAILDDFTSTNDGDRCFSPDSHWACRGFRALRARLSYPLENLT